MARFADLPLVVRVGQNFTVDVRVQGYDLSGRGAVFYVDSPAGRFVYDCAVTPGTGSITAAIDADTDGGPYLYGELELGVHGYALDILDGEGNSDICIQGEFTVIAETGRPPVETINTLDATLTVTDDSLEVVVNVGAWDEARIAGIESDVVDLQDRVETLEGGQSGLGDQVEVIEGILEEGSRLFTGTSLVEQVPSGADVPMRVSFGAAQSGGEYFEMDASGVITCVQAVAVNVRAYFFLGRIQSQQYALLVLRALHNGVQLVPPVGVRITAGDDTVPVVLEGLAEFEVGDTLEVQLVRDGGGQNSGRLVSEVVSLGWGDTPSALISIFRN